MPASRIYNNNTRIATAVTLKNGKFYQVFPVKRYFDSEDAWKQFWKTTIVEGIRFESPSAPAAPLPPQVTQNWKFTNTLTLKNLPPGRYYIGDICYALNDKTYDRVFGGQGYESGLYTCDDGFFMVDNTAYGDGAYKGTNGKTYGVDAGIIGIISEKIIDKNSGSLDGGHIHTFKYPLDCAFKRGIFTFTSSGHSFKIDTVGSDEDDYYEDSE